MKVAIIGCGNIGSKRALSMAKDKSCKIKYIVGRKKLKKKSDHIGKKIAKKLKTIYTNDRKLVLSSDVDSVILSTQPGNFKKIGSEILNSKKHLLIEKPLGLNQIEAKFLTKLAKRKGVFLKTGFNLRFDDGIQKVKKLIEKKVLGKIYFMNIVYVNGSVKTNKNRVGALSDIGSHSINLFEYFFGEKYNIENIQMQSNEYFKDDNGFLNLKKKNIICSIHFSFVRWENKFFLEISGEKGSITVESLPKWGKQTVTFSNRVYPSGKPKKKVWSYTKDRSWLNEWNFFKNCITKKNFKDINEGWSSMKIIDKIKKLSKKNV